MAQLTPTRSWILLNVFWRRDRHNMLMELTFSHSKVNRLLVAMQWTGSCLLSNNENNKHALAVQVRIEAKSDSQKQRAKECLSHLFANWLLLSHHEILIDITIIPWGEIVVELLIFCGLYQMQQFVGNIWCCLILSIVVFISETYYQFCAQTGKTANNNKKWHTSQKKLFEIWMSSFWINFLGVDKLGTQ